jgi:hypothetical protein
VHVSARAEDPNWIVATATFHEHLPEPAAFELRPAVPSVGVDAVKSAKLDVERALAGARLSTPVTAKAVDAAEAWEARAGAITAREVTLQLNDLANRIADEQDRLKLAADVESYPLVRAFQRLHDSLRHLAEAAIARSPKLTSYTVPVTMPVLAIAQSLYGGQDALTRAEAILSQNDVRDPCRVPAGTLLTVPA